MEIVIFVLKLFCSLIVGYMILKSDQKLDTSRLHEISLKNKSIVNRIFSPKQLGDIEVSFKKLNIPYNTMTVFLLSFIGAVCGFFIFCICKKVFPLISISLIISVPFIFIPFWIIRYVSDKEQEKLEAGLNDFFIQLKAALKVNSDIIEALRRIQNIVLEPFSSYTNQLLTEINTGKIPEKALEDFAQKVNIKKFSLYINNVRYCHIYGGDITTLTEKTQEILSEAIKQKKKRVKETRSICMVLYLLIFIDIYMYFSFIGKNKYYLDTMVNSYVGNIILNVNFLSIWGIIWLSKLVKRLDY